jgi:phage terminase small subunit
MTERDELSSRQERFCQEYTSDPKRNQTKAAIRAGYANKSARMQASRLMTNDNIRRRIKELYQESLEEAGYSVEAIRSLVLQKLTGIVLTDAADITKIVYKDDALRQEALAQLAEAKGGQRTIDFGDALLYIKPTDEWTSDERAAVKSIAMDKYGIKIETCDKTVALKALAEIVGLIRNPDMNVNVSITDSLDEARNRMTGAGPAEQ